MAEQNKLKLGRLRLGVIAGAAAFATATTGAGATVVDLNSFGFVNGEILSDQISGLTVSATSNGGGAANDFAIIFDTTDAGPTGTGDPDLAAPFDDPSTAPVEAFEPGFLVAVAEGGCGGGTCRADDNASGGVITFAFDTDKTFNSFGVFDMRPEALTVTLRDAMGAVVFSAASPAFNTDTNDNVGPNLYTIIELGGVVFREATFAFADSGAIGSFEIVPTPAALPLLLTGLAGLSFANRRRKR